MQGCTKRGQSRPNACTKYSQIAMKSRKMSFLSSVCVTTTFCYFSCFWTFFIRIICCFSTDNKTVWCQIVTKPTICCSAYKNVLAANVSVNSDFQFVVCCSFYTLNWPSTTDMHALLRNFQISVLPSSTTS